MFAGISAVQMPPAAFLKNPFRWLQAASRYRGTCIGAPNFAYDLCVRRIDPEQIGQLDLSLIDLAYCGAEPIRAETLRSFSAKFASAGFRSAAFYPCYGLAEATLFVCGATKLSGTNVVTADASALRIVA